MRHLPYLALCSATLAVMALSACGGDDDETPLPQLSAATPATLATCDPLLASLNFANTTFSAVSTVAAGTLTVAGQSIAEHCLVTGQMHQRVSTVDGQTYAIGFEMRLPKAWNGRFFHQVNGGTDGRVGTAAGGIGGAGPLTNGLHMGFAVISTDAGHNGAQNPLFGLDPQARLDYGYQAVGKVTPMAKSVINTAYGKGPDRSYLVGCSNGGRHAMVGASRYADQYDGILAGNPGFNLPKAAVAQLYAAQQLNPHATSTDLGTSLTLAERNLLAAKVVQQCDSLDGATDGLVGDVAACRGAFNLERDVPTCGAAGRDGTCLTAGQKTSVANIFGGLKNSAGTALYTGFPYDGGINANDWLAWKTVHSIGNQRDPVAVGFIFSTPPAPTTSLSRPPSLAETKAYALAFNFDTDAPRIGATDATFTESSLSFMTPPNPSDLSTLKQRGAKMIVYHGLSDGVFSPDDTAQWYDSVRTANGGDASNFARLYLVPGMNHCGGGPAADQFNLVDALVKWVEQGQAPDNVVASVRGTGNAAGVNAELPAGWSATRTRPLCAYPKVARYKGSGSIEEAASFECR